MKGAVVAGSVKHASAMISWLKLDPEFWQPVAYGDKIKETYAAARLVRPTAGIEEPHLKWVMRVLKPRVDGEITMLTRDWISLGENLAAA